LGCIKGACQVHLGCIIFRVCLILSGALRVHRECLMMQGRMEGA